MTGTTYPRTARVETKVKVATVASYFAGVGLLAVLQAVSADANLISGLPDAVEIFAVPLITSAITFVGGWLAKHTYRPNPYQAGHSLGATFDSRAGDTH